MRKVIDVTANTDFSLELTFDDGSIRRFDMKPYLDFPAFRSLKDVKRFTDVKVEHGTVTWASGQDISPDTVYLESVKIGEVVTA